MSILLELFCGTKSISKEFIKHRFDVITLDNDSVHSPDILTDILSFDTSTLPKIDILWASPPCDKFSIASVGKNWDVTISKEMRFVRTPRNEATANALKVLYHTLDIILIIKPRLWFIENPRGMMRKMERVNILHRKTVTYCQYGDSRMKPTDIFTNAYKWKPRIMCKNGDKCHEAAPRGARTGTQGIKGKINRAIIPPALGQELALFCL